MVGEISAATRTEVLGAIRSRYRKASKRDKSRMLDEFVALTGCHRKHAVRLLGGHERSTGRSFPKGRRIYDEAVRQALIVVWEASDRICGKRLKAALPSMVQSLERHGHLDLDPGVRERLFSASASTMDRLLRPVREKAGSRRRLKGASPRSRRCWTSSGRPRCRARVAGRSSPALATRRRSSKAIRMRSGWLRGSIYWVFLFRGRFLLQNHYPRSAGAPPCHSRTLTPRPPSVDSG